MNGIAAIKYYGGKASTAHRYPAPMFNTIIEPFAGGAAYAVRHGARAGVRVVLHDLDEAIVGAWRYLIAASPIEVLSLPLLDRGQSVDDLRVSQEARWLIGYWCNAGASAPCKTLSAWAFQRPGGAEHKSMWGRAARARLAAIAARVGHWEIRHASYETADNIEATWFVDPPYSGPAGRHYRHHKIDYAALAEWCRARRGQVIVCEQAGATWLPFESLGRAETARRVADKRSHEVVWERGPGAQMRLFTPEPS